MFMSLADEQSTTCTCFELLTYLLVYEDSVFDSSICTCFCVPGSIYFLYLDLCTWIYLFSVYLDLCTCICFVFVYLVGVADVLVGVRVTSLLYIVCKHHDPRHTRDTHQQGHAQNVQHHGPDVNKTLSLYY